MFRKLPFILICVIALILIINPLLPFIVKQILYAISLTIKSGIIFFLPLIIFSLLFKTLVGLANRATIMIALILLAVCSSNAISTLLSHFVGSFVYHFNLSLVTPADENTLIPAWTWSFPKLISNDKAMFAGILLGIILGAYKPKWAASIADQLNKVTFIALKAIAYLVPIFVVGFIVKLQFDGVMSLIIKDYLLIFVFIALAQFSYILFVYAALNRFNVQLFLRSIQNMLPAAITGFSTMSSVAAMPLTMTGTENNVQNKDLSRSVIPATVNIHLVGDCFAIPILAYAVMKSYGFAEPAFLSYLIFVFYFVIAKFSVAAIPGGGIVVMLPILESCLGFNGEMLSLITALYILFDPVITCANVLGNGAFAKFIDKLASLQKH